MPVQLTIPGHLLVHFNLIKGVYTLTDDQLVSTAVAVAIRLHQHGFSGRSGSFEDDLLSHRESFKHLHESISQAVNQSTQVMFQSAAVLSHLSSFSDKPSSRGKA